MTTPNWVKINFQTFVCLNPRPESNKMGEYTFQTFQEKVRLFAIFASLKTTDYLLDFLIQ